MRYDTPIYFQTITPGEYDPATGDYGDPTATEVMRLASVMDTSSETMMQVFGEIRQDSKTAHIQTHYADPFDAIRIGDKVYQVAQRRTLRFKDTFILKEYTDISPAEVEA